MLLVLLFWFGLVGWLVVGVFLFLVFILPVAFIRLKGIRDSQTFCQQKTTDSVYQVHDNSLIGRVLHRCVKNLYRCFQNHAVTNILAFRYLCCYQPIALTYGVIRHLLEVFSAVESLSVQLQCWYQ